MVRLAVESADALMDAFAARFDGGTLHIYSGDVELAELRFARPAFHPSSDGVIVARTLEADPLAAATGIATRYRALTAGGVPIVDGTVGGIGSGADLELDSVDIVSGARVAMTSFTYTYPLTEGC